MKKETLEKIFDSAHAVVINMNDTFYYACADSSTIDVQELEDLEPVIEKYGDDAFTAYEALRRGHDPQIPRNCTPDFYAAKAMIQEIMDKATKYGEFFELRDAIAEMKALEPKERKRISKLKIKLNKLFSFFTNR